MSKQTLLFNDYLSVFENLMKSLILIAISKEINMIMKRLYQAFQVRW